MHYPSIKHWACKGKKKIKNTRINFLFNGKLIWENPIKLRNKLKSNLKKIELDSKKLESNYNFLESNYKKLESNSNNLSSEMVSWFFLRN